MQSYTLLYYNTKITGNNYLFLTRYTELGYLLNSNESFGKLTKGINQETKKITNLQIHKTKQKPKSIDLTSNCSE